jgi:hypothetical protein
MVRNASTRLATQVTPSAPARSASAQACSVFKQVLFLSFQGNKNPRVYPNYEPGGSASRGAAGRILLQLPQLPTRRLVQGQQTRGLSFYNLGETFNEKDPDCSGCRGSF